MGVSIAPSAPAFCAACFQAKPDATFVDLGAAYDGPVIRDDAGAPVSVDDNVVCESCIRDAAYVLAIDPQPMALLRNALSLAERTADGWREYALSLEETYGRRPEALKRPPGRPPRTAPKPIAA